MKGKSKQIFYFERPGPVNTKKALELGIARALELNIKHLIVPSITGESAWKAVQLCRRRSKDLQVICVTFRAGGAWEISEEPPPAPHWREVPELKQRWEEWKRKGLKAVIFDLKIRTKLEETDLPIIQTTDLGYDIDASMAKYLGRAPTTSDRGKR